MNKVDGHTSVNSIYNWLRTFERLVGGNLELDVEEKINLLVQEINKHSDRILTQKSHACMHGNKCYRLDCRFSHIQEMQEAAKRMMELRDLPPSFTFSRGGASRDPNPASEDISLVQASQTSYDCAIRVLSYTEIT